MIGKWYKYRVNDTSKTGYQFKDWENFNGINLSMHFAPSTTIVQVRA